MNVTVDEVRLHDSTSDHSPAEANESSQPTTQSDGEPSEHILSFAELKELIEQGKTDGIPHNRIIPDELNTEKPSESKTAIRRKPWEIGDQEVAANEHA
ncbi:hypothetical protein EIP86_011483 [Pleurotus ostreatoroseus]|nr:hypothetical protein EIP86_011483 [Pleurotus ostreatoroseus]